MPVGAYEPRVLMDSIDITTTEDAVRPAHFLVYVFRIAKVSLYAHAYIHANNCSNAGW